MNSSAVFTFRLSNDGGKPPVTSVSDCGEIQTMSHIVDACPLTKFEGGLQALHEADEAAAKWLKLMWKAYENNNKY